MSQSRDYENGLPMLDESKIYNCTYLSSISFQDNHLRGVGDWSRFRHLTDEYDYLTTFYNGDLPSLPSGENRTTQLGTYDIDSNPVDFAGEVIRIGILTPVTPPPPPPQVSANFMEESINVSSRSSISDREATQYLVNQVEPANDTKDARRLFDASHQLELESDLVDTLYCNAPGCGAKFSGTRALGNLREHQEICIKIEGNTAFPFPCKTCCSRVYKRKETLLVHYRKHHHVRNLDPIVQSRLLPTTLKSVEWDGSAVIDTKR